jgi:hypothetical protein
MAAAKKKKGASNRSVQADAARKTKEGLVYAMEDLAKAKKLRETMDPYTKFSPRVEKRLAQARKFVYENRLAATNPASVKVKKAVKKNK